MSPQEWLEALEGISYSFFKADPCVDPHHTSLLNILSFAQTFAPWRENLWVISKVTWYVLFIKSTYWITKTGWLLQADQIQALLPGKYGEEMFQCGSWPLDLLYSHTTPSVRARDQIILSLQCVSACFRGDAVGRISNHRKNKPK